jgi:hypothetical protein
MDGETVSCLSVHLRLYGHPEELPRVHSSCLRIARVTPNLLQIGENEIRPIRVTRYFKFDLLLEIADL